MLGDDTMPSLSWSDPVRMLAMGNWRGAAAFFESAEGVETVAGPSRSIAQSAALLKTVTRCQSDLALGRPEAAWARLSWAAKRTGMAIGPDSVSDAALLRRPAQADGTPEEAVLRRWAAFLVWREQQLLAYLRQLLIDGEGGGARLAVILAMTEYLSRVEFDPWVWRPGDLPEELRNQKLLSDRRELVLVYASGLRRLVTATSGDISRSVWDDAGYYEGLRLAALEHVAARPAPAWTLHHEARVPACAGAALLWSYAQGWQASDAPTSQVQP